MTTLSDPAVTRVSTAPASRSTWSSGPCSALDHRFELVLPREGDFVEVLGALVRPFAAAASSSTAPLGRYELTASTDGPPWHVLRYDGERVTSGMQARDFSTMLAWHINRTTVEVSRERYVLMHAACVTSANVTVILPAEQESGKTTTTAGLLRQGYAYVTDEAVAIDPTSLRVTPFPKTLSLDRGSWHLFPELSSGHRHERARQWHVPAAHLGSRAEPAPVGPPRVIVFPQYQAGAETTLQPMSRAEALRSLALMTFEFQDHAGRDLRVLGRVAAGATVARLTIGRLEEAVDAIDQLVSNALLEDT